MALENDRGEARMVHRRNAEGGPAAWPEGQQLVHECEAFLAGRLAWVLEGEHRTIPAWAWCNVLAHCSAEQLAQMAAGRMLGAFTAAGAWERGLCFLARELLAQADERGCEPAEVQRDALVPLELEMTRDVGLVETGPGLFVMRVVAALGHPHPGGAP